MTAGTEPLTVLLVEDNPDHAELVKRSLEDHRTDNRLFHVQDGETALEYLFRRGEWEDPAKSPRPRVVLLDLRLPRVDGLEVLKALKEDERLSRIPVVVLTTSEAERDVAAAYGYHANGYLVKPLDFERFNDLIQTVGLYWLELNQDPWTGES